MTDYQIYDDIEFDSELEKGKIFRIYFSSKLRKFRIISFDNKYVDELTQTFSDVNPASFFMKQYGYVVENKISIINKFGYFPTGFIFELLKYIKLKYGSLSYVQMSKDCLKYIDDFLRPLKKELNGKTFEISNISDDSGRNVERKNEGKNEYKFRDYQRIAIEKLIFSGYGRGIIELPTSSGKSFCLCNFIYNIQKNINSKHTFLILVPNKQLVSQMYNDFIDYGMKPELITKFTAGLKKNEKYNPEAKIIIANRQYVFSNSDKLPRIDALFCDECLRQNSKILTVDGYKNIEDITTNDIVLSYNENEKIYEYKPVEKVHKNLNTSTSYNYFLKIELNDGKFLYATPNHKFFTSNRGYVQAKDLTFDDDLVIN